MDTENEDTTGNESQKSAVGRRDAIKSMGAVAAGIAAAAAAPSVLADHAASLKKYPPVPPGAPDPYLPPAAK